MGVHISGVSFEMSTDNSILDLTLILIWVLNGDN